ncbi:uracil-DNA glycosylase [Phytophthora nicotianae INRA-310]|uniref:Uracil-DNA glycosylase n=1 Tax=Phytophthora nicotianae (strain INRA-310) TaxID=761204 RepID=W2QH86_PHYN3|nr:uracil-DNA glycosylase [Phytophthora nicotianae INRA-310]ETN12221.1 uracil-DNA glycosylase [Phytophthora nicotianae INRA-310]
MAGATRDIRSFFAAQPPAKKRRTTQEDVGSDKPKPVMPEIEPIISGVEAVQRLVQDQEQDDGEILPVTSFVELQKVIQLRSLMHQSWFDLLQKEFARGSFQTLTRFLEGEEGRKKTIYPPPADVFAALRDCAFSDLKVVILGQDPYHGPQQAHGLSFSVRHGVPPPPSLKNIFKEAMNDMGIDRPTHGCLSCWSRQGVLLLNTVLTVRRGEPNSHKKRGWEQLTDAIISKVNKDASNVVFLLWGKPAQEKGALIDSKRHLVVRSSHPSPLGATKTNAPFLGSKCFSRANSYLKEHGKEPIDWSVQ